MICESDLGVIWKLLSGTALVLVRLRLYFSRMALISCFFLVFLSIEIYFSLLERYLEKNTIYLPIISFIFVLFGTLVFTENKIDC